MISLKKYLDAAHNGLVEQSEPDEDSILPAVIAAYGSALHELGIYSQEACPPLGPELNQRLAKLKDKLSVNMKREAIEAMEESVREQLQDWSKRTADHYRQKTNEVKDLLLVMARTAESVGARDQRCVGQMNEVTVRLAKIASLEDLTQIRASIEKSAVELKNSIERMTSEGKTSIEQLRAEVANYQVKLEEAEEVARRDTLTGLRNRLSVESQIQRRIDAGASFCVAIIDINDFKEVNDTHGHLAGDELLKRFAEEIKSACRLSDVIGRWGGDEFILLRDCGLTEARAQTDRLSEWVYGNYTVQGSNGAAKLSLSVSIGLAEHKPNETMNALLSRADADMYAQKRASRANKPLSRRSA
jgi:diguanylate cyclase (GGDEF)-like protein